jgi:hypothetical protein
VPRLFFVYVLSTEPEQSTRSVNTEASKNSTGSSRIVELPARRVGPKIGHFSKLSYTLGIDMVECPRCEILLGVVVVF